MSKALKQSGFTLIEMLVAIAVAGVFMSGMLINRGNFDSTVRLSSLTRDVALLVRQAQTYGAGGGSSLNLGEPHGVYLNENDPKEVILYANNDSSAGFDGEPDDRIIETLTLPEPYRISDFCFDTTNTIGNDCSSANSVDDLSVYYVRPSLGARFFSQDDSGATSSRQVGIEIVHESSSSTRMVIIDKTGFISTPQI